MRTLASLLTCALGLSLVATPASAAVVWVGDFETGDLSQFNYVLNGTIDGTPYITIVQDPVAQPANAARIELHNDAVWGNGLKRVELQHSPEDGRTDEGATTCFAWSFYLPEALPEDPGQTIGYWESSNSYSQTMAFQVVGEHLTFVTRHPNNQVQWEADGVVTPGEWHRIGMCVLWSTDPGVGTVDVWYDGEQVLTGGAAQTLPDGNSVFVQFGLLRGAIEFADVPAIVVDHALEGDTPEDVEVDFVPGGGGDTGTGGDSGGNGSSDGDGGGDGPGATDGGGDSTSGTPPPSSDSGGGDGGDAGPTTTPMGDGSGSTGATDGAGASDGGDDAGCSCRTRSSTAPTWMLGLFVLGAALRRRRTA